MSLNKAQIDLLVENRKTDAPTREEMLELEAKYQDGEISDEVMAELRESYEETKSLEREVFDK